jgi:uncharacterized membrane protein YbhN (UPF0104 family)
MAESSSGRSLLTLLAKIVVSVGLLAWLFHIAPIDRVWAIAAGASPGWLAVALGLYLLQLLASAWRWKLLLTAQHVAVRWLALVSSYLVATFFNNFLPSNIGGDVIRIGDTAAKAGSKTLATTVILFDRGIGLMGLVFVAALGSSLGAARAVPVWPSVLWGALALAAAVSIPAVLVPGGVAWLLQPLRVFHAEWVGERITRVTDALGRFRDHPGALVGTFAGAIVVQGLLVGFYVAIARSMSIPVPASALAVIVPVSFVVQMLPISVNGFGVRESTFTVCFARLGIPGLRPESAVAVSLMGAALMMLFSLSGAAAYVVRNARRARTGAIGV